MKYIIWIVQWLPAKTNLTVRTRSRIPLIFKRIVIDSLTWNNKNERKKNYLKRSIDSKWKMVERLRIIIIIIIIHKAEKNPKGITISFRLMEWQKKSITQKKKKWKKLLLLMAFFFRITFETGTAHDVSHHRKQKFVVSLVRQEIFNWMNSFWISVPFSLFLLRFSVPTLWIVCETIQKKFGAYRMISIERLTRNWQ